MPEEFEREIIFRPAYDKRHKDPKKNYGIHSVDIRFVLKNKQGAVQFLLYTGWNLPGIPDFEPMAADLGYHAPSPHYKGQMKLDACDVLDQGYCYYDGSGLNAKPIYDRLRREGSDGVWKALEDYHRELFGEKSG